MQHITRKRVATRVQNYEAGSWLDPVTPREAEPEGRIFATGAFFAFGLAALLCLGWWATAPEVLVGSARIEGGRVLVCKRLVGARVVERQYLSPAHGAGQQACPLVRFA